MMIIGPIHMSSNDDRSDVVFLNTKDKTLYRHVSSLKASSCDP
jgi:hypothetical protein